ncbi:DUF2231 domain-containing protein [Aquincola tertiaricarbonis]|uniref:DUF2231 domain-containing protein n=1 Tax=Aquincola tertiaricarbonis TaxID=391953 RepID=UPI000614D24D|nr:DUF2231 domain-containing protein [Aquincola tertiaricarbonis]
MTTATFDTSVAVHRPLHPLHVLLLAGSVPMFLGVLMSDIAYANSDQVQWKNFASWLNAGALLLSGLALLWSVLSMVSAHRRRRRPVLAGALLLAGWIIGFVNSLVHAKDAGATLPEGLVLAVIVFALMAVASWLSLSFERSGVRA